MVNNLGRELADDPHRLRVLGLDAGEALVDREQLHRLQSLRLHLLLQQMENALLELVHAPAFRAA